MAFPTIPTRAAGRLLTGVQANATATRTFPSLTGLTKNAGDLLIAICVAYQSSVTNSAFTSWGGGFTEVADFSAIGTNAVGVAYKWSTGSEAGTFTVTQSGTILGHAGFILLSIPGAHATTPPEVGGNATGANSNADSGSLGPVSWGVDDTLWISVASVGETGTGGAYQGIIAGGTNYTDEDQTGNSGDVVGAVTGGVMFRQLAADTEDPAAWNTDTSNARWRAITIAVRPVPAAASTDAPADLATATGAAFDASIEALVNPKTSGMDPVDKSSYTTASVTIGGADKVALVSVLTINASSPNTPSLSGPTGVDWAVAHDFFFDQVSTFRRLTVFAGTAASEATGTITIDYASQNQATVLWSVVEAREVNTTTSKGVVQTAQNQASGTALTVTLPNPIGDPANLGFGVFANGSNTTFTPGIGLIELHDLNASPETEDGTLHTAWMIAGADTTVDATSAITDPDLAGIALELLSTSAAPPRIPLLLMAPMVAP